MFLKEYAKAAGVDIEVRNFVVDYMDSTGTDWHVAQQVFINGVKASDTDMITVIRKRFPDDMTINSIFEIIGDLELQELTFIMEASAILKYPTRCIYVNKNYLKKLKERLK